MLPRRSAQADEQIQHLRVRIRIGAKVEFERDRVRLHVLLRISFYRNSVLRRKEN